MKIMIIFLLFSSLLPSLLAQELHKGFIEHFNERKSPFFKYTSGGKKAPFTYEFGASSTAQKDAHILLLKIDPSDRAGAGFGPGIVSNKSTHFGTYSARIKVPSAHKKQPNVGIVVGYYTYNMDRTLGLSEIDFEWLIADPSIIYIGTWTGHKGALKHAVRIINLAKGMIYSTTSKNEHESKGEPLNEKQNQPEKIEPIADYDASSQFYTYGFDWQKERLTWWILHPSTGKKIILWDYQGPFIPKHATRYKVNMWHTDNWPVFTNPNAIERPLCPYELEVDWMSYTTLDNSAK